MYILQLYFNKCGLLACSLPSASIGVVFLNACIFSLSSPFSLALPPSLPPSLPFPPQATITISSTLSSDTEESQSRLTLIFVILAVIIGPIIIITIITIILWRVSSIPIYLVRYYIYTCTHSLSTAKRTKIQI